MYFTAFILQQYRTMRDECDDCEYHTYCTVLDIISFTPFEIDIVLC